MDSSSSRHPHVGVLDDSQYNVIVSGRHAVCSVIQVSIFVTPQFAQHLFQKQIRSGDGAASDGYRRR